MICRIYSGTSSRVSYLRGLPKNQLGDGKKLDIYPGDMKVNDVLTLVNKHAKKLQEEQDAKS